MYNAILRQCPLFSGMDDAEIAAALARYDANRATYRKGDILSPPGRRLTRFGIVLSGSVQPVMDDVNGHHMIMATVTAGQTFGESLCLRGVSPKSLYIVAASDVVLFWLSADHLSTVSTDTTRFMDMIARKLLAMNDRIQVLSKPTVRGKIVAFLSQECARAGGRTITLTLNRDDMAAYLGVNRSALSRELGRMRDEGWITFHRNHFQILRGHDDPC